MGVTPIPAAAKAQRQRQQIDALKARRKPSPPAGGDTSAPAAGDTSTPPAPASPGAGGAPATTTVVVPAAAATGSGFLLGLFGWAVGLAYLRGGPDGVRKFLAAKFLNQT